MSCNIFVDMTVACNYCEDDEPMCGPCAIMHVIDFHSPEIGAKLLPYETRIQVMYMSKSFGGTQQQTTCKDIMMMCE